MSPVWGTQGGRPRARERISASAAVGWKSERFLHTRLCGLFVVLPQLVSALSPVGLHGRW